MNVRPNVSGAPARILFCIVILCLCLAVLPAALPQPVSAAGETYIKDYGLGYFPAYPYNTAAYYSGGAYVGCGPTAGAMFFGYFAHEFSAPGLLTTPGVGVNEGLNTAWALHGAAYLDTDDGGFGSPYDIKPGLEGYAADRGYEVEVMIHVSPYYDPASGVDCSGWNAYGSYGDAWNNDGVFWDQSSGTWEINAASFCTWAAGVLASGTCIQLTVDSNCDYAPEHWLSMVGFRNDPTYGYQYACYDTYSTTLEWHDITYVYGADPHCWAISAVRTVEWAPDNQAPVAVDDFYSTPVNTALVVSVPGVLGNDTDGDGDAFVQIDPITFPADGFTAITVSGSNMGAFSFTPNADFVGTGYMTYRVTDGQNWSNVATVTITVGSAAAMASCDAAGNAMEQFAPGQSVYVKGTGLLPGATYALWIQDDPVAEGDSLLAGQDPSGSQELVITDAAGAFGPVAIWNIPADAAVTYHEYDIVVDRQDGDNIGEFSASSDGIDSLAAVGFVAPVPEAAPLILFGIGLFTLGGLVVLKKRRAVVA
jgi:hypothetical protein